MKLIEYRKTSDFRSKGRLGKKYKKIQKIKTVGDRPMRRRHDSDTDFIIYALKHLGTATSKEISEWMQDHKLKAPSMHKLSQLCNWSSKITEVGNKGVFVVWGLVKGRRWKKKNIIVHKRKLTPYGKDQVIMNNGHQNLYYPVVDHILNKTSRVFFWKDVAIVLKKLYDGKLRRSITKGTAQSYASSYLIYMVSEGLIERITPKTQYGYQYRKTKLCGKRTKREKYI